MGNRSVGLLFYVLALGSAAVVWGADLLLIKGGTGFGFGYGAATLIGCFNLLTFAPFVGLSYLRRFKLVEGPIVGIVFIVLGFLSASNPTSTRPMLYHTAMAVGIVLANIVLYFSLRDDDGPPKKKKRRRFEPTWWFGRKRQPVRIQIGR